MGAYENVFCIKHCVSPPVTYGLTRLEFKECVAKWQGVRVKSRGIFPTFVHKIICNSLYVDVYVHFYQRWPMLKKESLCLK